MNILQLYYIGICLFLVAIGCLLLSRKKIICPHFFFQLFLVAMLLFPHVIAPRPYEKAEWYIAVIIIFLLVTCLWGRGMYTIMNVDAEMAKRAMVSVLERKGIGYDFSEEGKIVLPEYEKSITYRQTLNAVDIRFGKLRKLPIYGAVKGEFFGEIKQIKTTVFPMSSILFLFLGLLLLFPLATCFI